jgi:hypothetical protein
MNLVKAKCVCKQGMNAEIGEGNCLALMDDGQKLTIIQAMMEKRRKRNNKWLALFFFVL